MLGHIHSRREEEGRDWKSGDGDEGETWRGRDLSASSACTWRKEETSPVVLTFCLFET